MPVRVPPEPAVKGHGMGVAGKIRGDIHIRRHVGDGQGIVRARLVAGPTCELIARIGNGSYRCAVGAMIYRLGDISCESTTGPAVKVTV